MIVENWKKKTTTEIFSVVRQEDTGEVNIVFI